MIAWKYLNKPSATVAALQDYATMRDIINITPQETKELYDQMISVGSRPLNGLPTSWNPQAGEERLVKSLDTLDVIQERYRQAVEYTCAPGLRPACRKSSISASGRFSVSGRRRSNGCRYFCSANERWQFNGTLFAFGYGILIV